MKEISPTDTYTHGHHSSVLASHSWRTAKNSAGYLLAHLLPGQRLLDVGCGPGTISLDLAALVAHVVAIDSGEAAVEAATANQAAVGATNISFEVGDTYSLKFEDASFDVVHAHQVLQHLSDPVAALREMKRVCRPGGVVAVRDADYGGMFWSGADERMDRWREIYRKVAYRNDAEPDAARHMLAWAAEAELSSVTPSVETWLFATPEMRGWWASTWAERCVSSAFGDQAVQYGLATRDEMADIADCWRQWARNSHSWFAVVHGELLCSL